MPKTRKEGMPSRVCAIEFCVVMKPSRAHTGATITLRSWRDTRPFLLKSTPNSADRTDMDISAIALNGLQQAERQLEHSASRIASLGTASAVADTVDLSTEKMAMISAKGQAAVDRAILKTGGEMQKTAIDVMA